VLLIAEEPIYTCSSETHDQATQIWPLLKQKSMPPTGPQPTFCHNNQRIHRTA